MPNIVIVGAQWGDEGKGKIVDLLDGEGPGGGPLQRRPQRRPHRHRGRRAASSCTSSPRASCIPASCACMGNGMVIDPWALEAEMSELRAKGIAARREPPDLGPRAPDPARTTARWRRWRRSCGAAARSAPPCAASGPRTRTRPRGAACAWATCCVRGTLADEAGGGAPALRAALPRRERARPRSTGIALLRRPGRVRRAPAAAHRRRLGRPAPPDGATATRSCSRARRPRCSTSTTARIRSSRRRRRPRAARSRAWACRPPRIDGVLGIAKAYTTRVGAGPLPVRDRRRAGGRASASAAASTAPPPAARAAAAGSTPWSVRYAVRVNGFDYARAHEARRARRPGRDPHLHGVPLRGRGSSTSCPGDLSVLERCEPVYETLPGWKHADRGRARLRALPDAARRYVDALVGR